MELIIKLIGAAGLLGIIITIVKWIITVLTRHADRMERQVDRIINVVENVRNDVSTVKTTLVKHIEEEAAEFRLMDKRLDKLEQHTKHIKCNGSCDYCEKHKKIS